MLKRIAWVLSIAIAFILFTNREVYASFGISPADLSFAHLSPGMELEKVFLLSRTDINNDVRVVVEADIEGVNDWIIFEPGVSFIFPKGQSTQEMKVVVKVPEDVSYREDYDGYIVVKFIDDKNITEVAVVGGVGIRVGLATTDEEVSDLLIRNMRMDNTPFGDPIKLILTIENRGNREDSVDEVSIRVSEESSGETVFEEKDNNLENVSPGKTQEAYAFFENNLAKGNYKSKVFVIYKGDVIAENILIFSIIDAVAYERDKGIIFLLGVYKIPIIIAVFSLVIILIVVLRKLIKKKYFVK